MLETTVISGQTAAAIEQQLTTYLQRQSDSFQHRIQVQQSGRTVLLDIDIDPGGGFESGYATTRFEAPVTTADDFAFTIHPEGFLSDFAKLFGLQDEVVGYPEFDEKVIIKTNNKEKVKAVFKDETLRQTISTISSFNLQLGPGANDSGKKVLTLEIEEGITEPVALVRLYRGFCQIWQEVEAIA